jgi:hypothetical protein
MTHQNVRSKPAASLVAVGGPVTDIISAQLGQLADRGLLAYGPWP